MYCDLVYDTLGSRALGNNVEELFLYHKDPISLLFVLSSTID